MNALDAIETINSWRRVLIEGNAEHICCRMGWIEVFTEG